MAYDISWVLPAHRIRTFTAQTALEPFINVPQERPVCLALLAVKISPAFILGHLPHQSIYSEAGRKDLFDGLNHLVVNAVAMKLADEGFEGHFSSSRSPVLPHTARESLRDTCGVKATVLTTTFPSMAEVGAGR